MTGAGGVEPPTEAGERKRGGGIGRSRARRRRGRSWEDILRRGSGEANRGAQEAAADGVGARSCFCSKRSEPSDGKSDGRHRRVTWPAEEQEVVRNMVDAVAGLIKEKLKVIIME